ncbi:MAG: hypothetical protein DCF22_10570 [Leptolyngbya sp.]|nr:MAG: hypothetical protein DCF22_10570 [Leptolyngbya sp.]
MPDIVQNVKDAIKNAVQDSNIPGIGSDKEVAPDLVDENDTTQNMDAEMLKEAISEGDTKGLSIDVGADYESAQDMSTGSVDADEAEAIVAPDFEVSTPAQVAVPTMSANDQIDYTDMAKDINPAGSAAGNVTDELMKKALDLGTPGS